MFNLDIIEHEAAGEPWEFSANGKTWRVPHISDLTISQQRAADRGFLELVLNEVAEVLDGDEWKPAGPAAADLVLGRRRDQVTKLQIAWLAHAGMEPGESPASSS